IVDDNNVGINKQYLETIRSVEKDQSRNVLYRAEAALFQAFFHSPHAYNNSHIAARKYLKVLDLCDEAHRQGVFSETSRYQRDVVPFVFTPPSDFMNRFADSIPPTNIHKIFKEMESNAVSYLKE
ncbi:hypothetical protein HDU76_004966, partial [Blyttiomyces sp. JEL0837]